MCYMPTPAACAEGGGMRGKHEQCDIANVTGAELNWCVRAETRVVVRNARRTPLTSNNDPVCFA